MATPTIDRTNYNALVDDSGGNLDGTNWNKNQVKIVLLDPIDTLVAQYVATRSAVSTTGNITALALPSGPGPLVIYMTNATLSTIQGITAGLDGQQLTLVSTGAGQVDLSHLDGSGTALGKIRCFATTGKTSLAAGVGTAVLEYDLTNTRWQLVQHEQGDYIDYGGTSTIVGWSSRTTTKLLYKLSGRSLSLIWDLEGTSNATTVTATLPYTSISGPAFDGCAQATDNGTTLTTPGLSRVPSASSTLNCYKDMNAAVWTNTGSKFTIGQLMVQVQ